MGSELLDPPIYTNIIYILLHKIEFILLDSKHNSIVL